MDAPGRGELRPSSGKLVDAGTQDPRPVVVVGATGKTGRAVAEALLAAVSRSGPRCARAGSPPPPTERHPSPSTW